MFLIPTLHALIFAIWPCIKRVRNDFSLHRRLEYWHRDRLADRLQRVLQALLALTARIDRYRVGRENFAPIRPKPLATPASPVTRSSAPAQAAPRTGAKRPLSARQIAKRLAAIFAELEAIARELLKPLPATVRALCNEVRHQAGLPIPAATKTLEL